MDDLSDEAVAHAAFGLGQFMGTLMKLRKVNPERASDLYQQMLGHMPMVEIDKFCVKATREVMLKAVRDYKPEDKTNE